MRLSIALRSATRLQILQNLINREAARLLARRKRARHSKRLEDGIQLHLVEVHELQIRHRDQELRITPETPAVVPLGADQKPTGAKAPAKPRSRVSKVRRS